MISPRVTVRISPADYEYLQQQRCKIGDVLYYTIVYMMGNPELVARARQIQIHKPYIETAARLPAEQYNMMKAWGLTPGAVVSIGLQLARAAQHQPASK